MDNECNLTLFQPNWNNFIPFKLFNLIQHNFTAFSKIHALISNPKPFISKPEDLKFEHQPF
jgi:hypothetical protein